MLALLATNFRFGKRARSVPSVVWQRGQGWGETPAQVLQIKANMGMRNIPPSVTYPSPNEFLETVFPITAITKASQATVTCATYPFTSEDPFVTQVTFKQVNGMLPINGITCLITSVLSSTQFQVDVDTTNFPAYTSGGVIVIDTGQPPTQTQGAQTFNTPWQNIL